jgi:hypothetical protein
MFLDVVLDCLYWLSVTINLWFALDWTIPAITVNKPPHIHFPRSSWLFRLVMNLDRICFFKAEAFWLIAGSSWLCCTSVLSPEKAYDFVDCWFFSAWLIGLHCQVGGWLLFLGSMAILVNALQHIIAESSGWYIWHWVWFVSDIHPPRFKLS